MAYKITSACVSCGSCADVCPAGAISQGDDHIGSLMPLYEKECREILELAR